MLSPVSPLASTLAEELGRLEKRKVMLLEDAQSDPSAETLHALAALKQQIADLQQGIAATRHDSKGTQG